MNTLQISVITVCIIVLIPSLIWYWLDALARRKAHRELEETCKELNRKIDEGSSRLKEATAKVAWFESLFNATSDMVLAYEISDDDLPTNLIAANDAVCRTLEYTREQLFNMTPLQIETIQEPIAQRAHTDVELLTLSNEEIIAQDSKYALRNIQHLIKRLRNGENVIYETSLLTKSEHRIPVEISAKIMDGDHKNIVIYGIRDTSEKHKAGIALREAQQQFKDLFSAVPVGVAIYSAQQTLVDVNFACLRMFGTPGKGEFEKYNLFDSVFLSNSVKESLGRGKTVNCETVFDFDELLDSHSLVSSRRGKAHFEILFHNLGVDHEHNPMGYIVIIRDMTDLHEVEEALQLLEAQLRQAKKMEAIGTMAGGIAHDFNNILTPIMGYADIGLELLEKDDNMYSFMSEIKKSTMRAKELVHQILLFSRQSDEKRTLIHLVPIVKEVAKQQSAALPKNINVTCSSSTKEDLVLANPTQIHQVLTNFCTNAAYAMKETGGNLDVRLSVFTMGWRHRQEFPKLKKGRYIRISVKDTGCGIKPEILDKIFSPFFSTKPSGEGTGMGLSVVHGIIESLGGGISVVSELGQGSTFHVALPLQEVEESEQSEDWQPPASNNEKILFVDDETGITRMAASMLMALDYRPAVVSNSRKALQIFSENPDDFDLLITDQVMPELTGAELAAEIHSIRPDLPTIICSGFSDMESNTKASELGVDEFLVKPITMHELGDAIRRVLDRPNI